MAFHIRIGVADLPSGQSRMPIKPRTRKSPWDRKSIDFYDRRFKFAEKVLQIIFSEITQMMIFEISKSESG